MTATIAPSAPKPVEPGAPPPVVEDTGLSRWIPALGVIVLWIIVYQFTKGQNTLALPGREHTDLHQSLTDFNNSLLASRDTNPVMQFTNSISEVLRDLFDWLQRMISIPNFPRPVPEIGWLGVVALLKQGHAEIGRCRHKNSYMKKNGFWYVWGRRIPCRHSPNGRLCPAHGSRSSPTAHARARGC